jgi:type IV secretory pathway VirB4 component
MLELAQDEDDVASGRSVYVTHHFSIVVRAASLEELDRRVAIVLSLLSDAGVTGTRETDGLVPAFYGQLPGNRRWWPRPAQIKSINAVAFAPLHDVPRGRYRGRWGAPIIMLRTTADTEYAFHFHVQGSAQIPAEDLGNGLTTPLIFRSNRKYWRTPGLRRALQRTSRSTAAAAYRASSE